MGLESAQDLTGMRNAIFQDCAEPVGDEPTSVIPEMSTMCRQQLPHIGFSASVRKVNIFFCCVNLQGIEDGYVCRAENIDTPIC